MILTTHALAGAVIGKYAGDPALIIPLSIAVHFAMDRIPHGEYVEVFGKNTSFRKSGLKVMLDFFFGIFLVLVFLLIKSPEMETARNILLGAFFSILPDLVTGLYWKFRWKFLEKYYRFHSKVHKHPREAPERQWTLGNAKNDILLSLLAIALLFWK